jgi:VanZ family protein
MPAYLWAFFIAILCGIPGKDIPTIGWLELLSFDKFVHASVFFVLFFLFHRATIHKSNKIRLYISLVCAAYGGLLEILQGLVFIDRSADVYDFIANTSGVLLAYYLTRNTTTNEK